MTPSEIFTQMPTAFNAEKAGDMEATVVFDLSGDNGGQWNVVIANGEAAVSEGEVADPTATISMAADDYVAMTTGDANPVTLFMTGKVKVTGDLSTVMKMQSIFDRP